MSTIEVHTIQPNSAHPADIKIKTAGSERIEFTNTQINVSSKINSTTLTLTPTLKANTVNIAKVLTANVSGTNILTAQGPITAPKVTANTINATAANFTTLQADSIDFDGDVTVDGITANTVVANGGVTVDNITIDGTEIDLSSGDLTLDVAGDIILDADGGDIFVNDGGTTIGKFTNSSTDFVIKSSVSDKDLIIKGNDGGSEITALTLDMSEAGKATFNAGAVFSGVVTSTGSIGVGTTSPDTYVSNNSGIVAVNQGDTPVSAAASGNADEIVIMGKASGANPGMSIISGTGQNCNIFFGDSDDVDIGGIAYEHAGNDMKFYVNTSARMQIDSNGFVGIGGNPQKALHIIRGDSDGLIILDANNTTSDQGIVWSKNYGTGGTSSGQYWGLGVDSSENQFILAYDANAQASFAADAKVMFDANGRVYLKGVASWSVSYGAYTGDLNVGGSGIAIGSSASNFRNIYGGGLLNFHNGTNNATLTDAGVWTDASDISIKRDIVDLTHGIDTVKSLKPRSYYMKSSEDNSDPQIGFVAQEIESILPEVVVSSEARDGTEFKGVSYGKLTSVLTKALQEAIVKIETLEAKVAALESGE